MEMFTDTNGQLALDQLVDERGPVRFVTCGELAAVVRSVSLNAFSDEALEERLHNLDALEELAREHNAVIAAVYQEQSILPAKFGHIFPNDDVVRTALTTARDTLIAQLERLEGCDEWAVHVYADPKSIEKRMAAEHPTMRDQRSDLASAQPGRAYLLKRRYTIELAALTEQALSDLSPNVFDRLSRLSVASEASPVGRSRADSSTPREVLRAAFLVRRTELDAFLSAVDATGREKDGITCARSGPWPPYSFAGMPQESQ